MNDPLEIAENTRDACVRVALQAYEDAGISGLCGEGRWELAVQAMRALDLGALLAHGDPTHTGPGTDHIA